MSRRRNPLRTFNFSHKAASIAVTVIVLMAACCVLSVCSGCSAPVQAGAPTTPEVSTMTPAEWDDLLQRQRTATADPLRSCTIDSRGRGDVLLLSGPASGLVVGSAATGEQATLTGLEAGANGVRWVHVHLVQRHVAIEGWVVWSVCRESG